MVEIVRDARRFQTIGKGPLQIFISAEQPQWITVKPTIKDNWSACVQTLEGHSELVNSVFFSHDSKLLAPASVSSLTITCWHSWFWPADAVLSPYSNPLNAESHQYKKCTVVPVWTSDTGTQVSMIFLLFSTQS